MNGKRAFALVAVVGAILAPASEAPGKKFEPTRKDDPVPGKCKPNNCSLREALSAANARVGADRVVLGKGRYRMEIPDDGNDDNGSGDFDLTDEVSVVGEGPSRTTVDGAGVHRVFSLNTFSPHSLKGMTIRGGAAPGSIGGGVFIGPSDATIENVIIKDNRASNGAGIHSVSTDLRLTGSTIKRNDATGRGGGLRLSAGVQVPLATIKSTTIKENSAATGGGIDADATNVDIFTDEPQLTVSKSEIAGNFSDTFGGGIASSSTMLIVKQTTISSNTADEGAGIDLRPAPELPITKIQASTISGNTATNKAGGILADGNPYTGSDYPDEPDVRVLNSTIAGNTADNDAGGVLADNEAIVDIDSSSIGYNTANFDQTGTAVAGGVYQHSNANFSVDDSVLAHNGVGQGGSDPDCSATQVFSGAGNVISSMTGCSISFTEPFNAYSAEPIAENLADNGGPTETMALAAESSAIGFANNCPKRDQRGERRPNNCDSGSFENRPK